MNPRQTLHHRRAWRALLGAPLLVVVLLVTGCTSRFIYNRLDTLASWYFEGLVSLNDVQRTELRSWLESTLAWHRQSELKRYAAFINDLTVTAERPGTHEDYDAFSRRFEGLITDLIAKTAPEASHLLLTLSPKQVDQLMDNLAEKTREGAQEGADALEDHEWHAAQVKTVTRQVKRWTGQLTDEQKRIVAAHMNDLEPTFVDWEKSQQVWQGELRTALLSPEMRSEEAPSPRILELLKDPGQSWTPEYSAKVARNRERYLSMFSALDASLTTQQRDHLRVELTKLSQQLHRLAKN